ncbi:MAG: (2Fe-2S)-binding protein, partial [Betaproteobacteria bacterium]
MKTIQIQVNGQRSSQQVAPRTHLGDFLRDQLQLTGTHLGCEHGVCGACTVLVDGAPVRSCITYAV